MTRPRPVPSREPAPRSIAVWDLPTRLFHGALILLIPFSYVTITNATGARVALFTTLHELSGYTILVLLAFRVVWGFVGSPTARFRSFLRSPLDALAHLRHFARREPDTAIGHNPAGGWMVLFLLVTLALQAITGLFTFDDVPEGPLGGTVPEATAYWLTAMHHANFNVLLALIGLHVLAIAAYALVRRQNLVRPMITGRKTLPPTADPPSP